jgi:hypothetical protein
MKLKTAAKIGYGAALLGALAIVATRFLGKEEPAQDEPQSLLACSFCVARVRAAATAELPPGWTEFVSNNDSAICCGSPLCKVKLARYISNTLTARSTT